MPEPITEAKLRGLREALARDNRVVFHGGATLETETRYKLTTPLGAVLRFTEAELRRAYEIALRGPAPLPQPATPAELDERYGEKAPW